MTTLIIVCEELPTSGYILNFPVSLTRRVISLVISWSSQNEEGDSTSEFDGVRKRSASENERADDVGNTTVIIITPSHQTRKSYPFPATCQTYTSTTP